MFVPAWSVGSNANIGLFSLSPTPAFNYCKLICWAGSLWTTFPRFPCPPPFCLVLPTGGSGRRTKDKRKKRFPLWLAQCGHRHGLRAVAAVAARTGWCCTAGVWPEATSFRELQAWLMQLFFNTSTLNCQVSPTEQWKLEAADLWALPWDTGSFLSLNITPSSFSFFEATSLPSFALPTFSTNL